MIPYEFNAERFSRWVAYVLRHNPERYGLQPDRHGFVDFGEFLLIAKRRYPEMSPERLRELIAGSPGRFEIAEGRVRARYGHSIPVEPLGEPVAPPAALYHGTESERVASILAEGLRPTERRFLHLSQSVDEAVAIARRKTERPAVLRIRAQEAQAAGILFYREGNVYLTTAVPAAFVSEEPLPAASSS